MGTNYYLACHDCRCAIEVGKNGYLWQASEDHMVRIAGWLLEHQAPHRLAYVTEHDFDPRVDGVTAAAEGYAIDGQGDE